MNILIACLFGLMVLALGIACSALWYAFDISSLATKNLNRIESGYQWSSQDMAEDSCRREAAARTLRISIIFWILLVVAAVAYLVILLIKNNVPLF